MPAKKVLQYTCDRCPRVWYVPEGKSEPTQTVKVDANVSFIDDETKQPVAVKVQVTYECLCPGCTKTVGNAIAAIGRDLKKSLSERGAKRKKKPADDAAGKGTNPLPAGASSTIKPPTEDEDDLEVDEAEAPAPRSAVAPAGGVAGGKVVPVAPSAPGNQTHPMRR